MRVIPATSLMVACLGLGAARSGGTGVSAPTTAELAAIQIPIRFTMIDETDAVGTQQQYQQPQQSQSYQPPQHDANYYKTLPQQPIVQYTPQHPYQRACGTMATDICEVPVTIPPGATAEQVYQMGNQALGQRQMGQNLAYMRKSAEMGYAPAQYVLGEYYLTHRIAENDWPTKGAYWLGQAAAQGDAAAELALGIVYEDGSSNVPRDQVKAVALLQAAAAQHKALAEYRIGMDYEFGNGLQHSRSLAIQYLRRAAAGGVPTAEAKANFLAKNPGEHYQSAGELEGAMYPPPPPHQPKPGECPFFQTFLTGPRAQAQRSQFCLNHPGCPDTSNGYSGTRCAG